MAADLVAYDEYEDTYYELPAPVEARVSYSEIRWWSRWLDTFTASDLADAMGVDLSMGRKGIKALLWHGICEDTGDMLDGPEGPEPIIHYIPLPPGPREHYTMVPPERMVGYTEILSPRGVVVRIRTDRDTRKNLSTPGTRHKMKLAEKRYHEQVEATMKRAEEAKKKAATSEPKWRRKKKPKGGGAVITTVR